MTSFALNLQVVQDPGRTWPVLHNVMALVLGGKHRWNEMLFPRHDRNTLCYEGKGWGYVGLVDFVWFCLICQSRVKPSVEVKS